jgi:hypothetical protein
MKSSAVAEPETATFYSWMGADEKGRAFPSGQVIHISGGTNVKSDDGKRIGTAVVEAHFNKGVCSTSNPEIIAELRRLMATENSGITEDKEEFYAHTMTAEQKMKRGAVIGKQQEQKLEEVTQENNRLRALLEDKGKNTPARRESTT